MTQYIALLRGINVGGKNRVVMKALKEVFESLGYCNVITYINSGNVLFSASSQDIFTLIQDIEAKILEHFHLSVPVTVRSIDALEDVLNQAPDWWDIKKHDVNYVMFVIAPATVEEIMMDVGAIDPQYESIHYYKDVIFWTAARETFNKARWSKIASSKANHKVTIRNANTVKKLFDLAQ